MLSELRFLMQEEHGECSSNDYEEPFDNATLYDFHIVYSSSYNVPVIYFRVHSSGMSIFTSL
ncbi:hypothetical protein Hanom_Chr16g01496981 [Helianthus anomalus]